MWRARSASDKTEDWPFWYLTDDQPADRNKTAEAYEALHGEKWPPSLPFAHRDLAMEWADRMNAAAS